MFGRTFTVLVLFLAGSAVLAQVYRWVDEDGVVHYSDQPHAGAEEVELESAPTMRMPQARPARPGRSAPGDVGERAPAASYSSLSVASPAAEETLWNIGGVLDVRLDLQPSLQPNHQLRVYFDGSPMTVDATSFQLQEVYRGEHNLQAEVLDANGEPLIRSEPIRFYVQQTSIINPRGG